MKHDGDEQFVNLTDEQIVEKAKLYGNPNARFGTKHFVGIEDPTNYDGVSYWKCQNCNSVWDRWTNKLLEDSKV
jgi:hypothetical protein